MASISNMYYFLGLDIGTGSTGYAATDKQFNPLKFHGKPVWGVHLYNQVGDNKNRRSKRTQRRRLDRRQQRVTLLQELFAKEIAKIDPGFFKRLQESYVFREQPDERFALFKDPDYTDKDYYENYPTIHHLIVDLMMNPSYHDPRLVYLACAWLVAHRGHFLSNISMDNLTDLKDFNTAYEKLMVFFRHNAEKMPWEGENIEEVARIIRMDAGMREKKKELERCLLGGKKADKKPSDEFPYSVDAIISLLTGFTVKVSDLFGEEAYSECGSFALKDSEDTYAAIMSEIGNDYELIDVLRDIYEWSALVDALRDKQTISEAMVDKYERHEQDLKLLKYMVRKYLPKKYSEIFRDLDDKNVNYPAYTYHTNGRRPSTELHGLKDRTREKFCKYILGIVKDVTPDEEDQEIFEDMKARLEKYDFMPKQKDGDNRIVPYQLYWYELSLILKNASCYLPFLNKTDAYGTVADKIESVFLFRVPYYVGPLNAHAENAWFVRTESGKIYPWNFDEKIDKDASEEAFIQNLTNTCTYLPGEPVISKDSLCYHKYMVLNEINNIRINKKKISVELKQKIYLDLFMKKKKVTRNDLETYLIKEGELDKDEVNALEGINVEILANLRPQIEFANLLKEKKLTEEEVERIIERSTYSEDKGRLDKWLVKYFPRLSTEDRKYICSVKCKDFGRLSRKFLCEMEGVDPDTGEVTSLLGAMWNTNYNLQELLFDERYGFKEALEEYRSEYFATHTPHLKDRMEEMYLSPAVRKIVYRTFAVIDDIVKVYGVPAKIYIETTRDSSKEGKGKRTKSRKEQLVELYDKCLADDNFSFRDEVIRLQKELDKLGDYAEQKLQSEYLFLYFTQLGKCMYSGKDLPLEELNNRDICNRDHIIPRTLRSDDSVHNNKVLTLSKENKRKDDDYPVKEEIRKKMTPFWSHLKKLGLITEEKYNRLVRATPLTDKEKWDFINRQIVETSQSAIAVATLLKERYPDTEIVYCKAQLVSEFRQEFGLLKSRNYNDLHHAVDAYLNIVTGYVHEMRFNRQWFNVNQTYNLKTKTMFEHPVTCGGEVVWDGIPMLEKVKKIAQKNTGHVTQYAFMRKGKLFDEQLLPRDTGLVPRKKEMPTEIYGGYNKSTISFFIPVQYQVGKKRELFIMPVEVQYGDRFLADAKFAEEYTKKRIEEIKLNTDTKAAHQPKKTVDSISFPLGMRPWKINTMLSLDGFRICITGSSERGAALIIQTLTQFSSDYQWNTYLKRVERFVEKNASKKDFQYDEGYDYITAEKNLELYDLYISKFEHSIYNKRRNVPLDEIKEGRDKFAGLNMLEQAEILLQIHMLFGRSMNTSDIRAIGGKKIQAKTSLVQMSQTGKNIIPTCG